MYNLPQTPSERERESDRLFLEFAVKRCALTLSRAEILALTEQILTPASERQAGAILPAYSRTPDEPAPSPPAAEEDPYFSALLSEEEASSPLPPSPALDSPPSPEISDELPSKKSRQARKKQQKKKKSFFGDLLFYGVLIALIVGVVVLTGSGGQGPRSFAGFTVQTVLTSSMESVFPKGSLVISRYTEPDTLAIGDDITFKSGHDRGLRQVLSQCR